MSLRHVSLREMGWSRNPTSFGFARRNRNQRVRRRTDQSKYAFLASHKTVFFSADARSEWLGVYSAPLVRAMKLLRGEKKWVTKKTPR